jgi:hypothetical protein
VREASKKIEPVSDWQRRFIFLATPH